ncbi:autotransporter outer membrane beta-barrel domain-containing protein [Pseudomonas sp. F1_0610]|uniref:autotransporter outer membrane beta-barrel domain-containing protein n=1 Tax=Pseudomonas sp. F1_0610 TaxID=3114284 RepID=UPI0039C0D4C0
MKYSINKITLSLLAVIASTPAFAAPTPAAPTSAPAIHSHVDKISLLHNGDVSNAKNSSTSSIVSVSDIGTDGQLIHNGHLYVELNDKGTYVPEYTPSPNIVGGTAQSVVVVSTLEIKDATFNGNSNVLVTGDNNHLNCSSNVKDGCAYAGFPREQYARPINTNNTFNNRSTEYIYSLKDASKIAESINAKFNDASVQVVGNKGGSTSAVFNDNSAQVVANGGVSVDAVFNHSSQQVLQGNATATAVSAINTILNNTAVQFLLNDAIAEKTVLNDKAWQVAQKTAQANGNTLNGQAVQWLADTAKATDTTLNNRSIQILNNNAQTINSHLNDESTLVLRDTSTATNTNLADRSELYVGEGSKAITTSLKDQAFARVEKNATLVGKTTLLDNTWLALQADATQGAFAEDITAADNTIITVLNGADREDKAHIGKLVGKTFVNFEQESGKALHGNLLIDELNESVENITFKYSSKLLDDKTDFVTINNGIGKHFIQWIDRDTGVELINNPNRGVDFVKLNAGDANFRLIDASKREIDYLDVGTFVYGLTTSEDAAGAKTWTLTSTGRLSPSTIAALNVAAAPQLIFQNELQNLRYRMVTLKDAKQETGVWVRALGGRTEAKEKHLDFEIKQQGIEIGVDHGWGTDSGLLVFGVFGNTSKNDVDVKHGRTSNIDSYSLGSYLSYFDDSGLYVDGVLKYNNFDTDVKATSTNGYSIAGSYKTKALGASVELGYSLQQASGMWYEPYARLSYSQISSKSYQLDNGMDVKLGKQKSIQGEAGVSIGHQFDFTAGTVTPYVKAAVMHEFASNNKVTINNRYGFKNDLSGTGSKLGLGANVLLKNNISIFAEVDHQFGSKVKAPVQGNIGLRYSF